MFALGHRVEAVGGDGVDLPVVGDHPERLGELPLRQGIGGEALMEEAKSDLEILVLQIDVELLDVCRHHQPFVRDDTGGKRGNVKVGIACELTLDLFAREVDQRIEAPGPHQGIGSDKELGNHRQTFDRLFTQRVGVDGDFTAIVDHQVVVFANLSDRFEVVGVFVENHRHGVVLGEDNPLFLCDFCKKFPRNRKQQSASVTGLSVGGDRPAVHHSRKRRHGIVEVLVRGFVVDGSQQSETAIVLERGIEISHKPTLICFLVGSANP